MGLPRRPEGLKPSPIAEVEKRRKENRRRRLWRLRLAGGRR
jgi:hypothetical protein